VVSAANQQLQNRQTEDTRVVTVRELDALELIAKRARDVIHAPGNEAALKKLEWSLREYDGAKRAR
jgi:hypothetical protein